MTHAEKVSLWVAGGVGVLALLVLFRHTPAVQAVQDAAAPVLDFGQPVSDSGIATPANDSSVPAYTDPLASLWPALGQALTSGLVAAQNPASSQYSGCGCGSGQNAATALVSPTFAFPPTSTLPLALPSGLGGGSDYAMTYPPIPAIPSPVFDSVSGSYMPASMVGHDNESGWVGMV